MRVIITHDSSPGDRARAEDMRRYIERFTYGRGVYIIAEDDHTRAATSEIDLRERLDEAYKNARMTWSGPDNDPIMDWTSAIRFTNSTDRNDHDQGCYYKGNFSGICSCSVLKHEYERRTLATLSAP